MLYFQATKNDQLQSRHIFELKLLPNKRSSTGIRCLTCDISNNNETIGDKNNPKKDEKNDNKNILQDLQKLFQPINHTIQNAQINEKIVNVGKWEIFCDNYDASFSVDFKYFVLSCLGPVVPYLELWENSAPEKRKGKHSKCFY